MSAARIIVGVLALLVALFSGGCVVLLGYDFFAYRLGQSGTSGIEVPIIGLVIFIVSSMIALAALRGGKGRGD